MKRSRTTAYAAAGILCLALGSCAGGSDSTQFGIAAGALVGGVVGSGMTAGSIIGTAAGATVGGFIGYQVGKRL